MRELIGEKIRDLRVKHNMTLECLSNDLGMSRQRLARIEKGQSDISLDILQKLSKIFDVKVGESDKCQRHTGSLIQGAGIRNIIIRNCQRNDRFLFRQ